MSVQLARLMLPPNGSRHMHAMPMDRHAWAALIALTYSILDLPICDRGVPVLGDAYRA